MLHGDGRVAFAAKACDALGVVNERRRQNFQGDVTIEFRVSCPIDQTQAACTERGDNFVRSDPGAGGECHARRIIPTARCSGEDRR